MMDSLCFPLINSLYLTLFLLPLLGCQPVAPSMKKVPTPKKATSQLSHIHNPSLDILFIIDNSPSMKYYQNILKENASLFINHFFNVDFIDYHIGVTTSYIIPAELSQKTLLKGRENEHIFDAGILNEHVNEFDHQTYSYIDRYTPNGDELLSNMMFVGSYGGRVETFLNIPERTFSREIYGSLNSGFLRSDAQLAVFIVTDTDDQSDLSPEASYKYLLSLKNGDEKKIHYALAAITHERGKCLRDFINGVRQYPSKLIKMVELFNTRGYFFDLCKSDYGEDLAHLAEQLVQSVLTFELDDLPDITSIEVCYRNHTPKKEHEFCEGGQTISNDLNGWTYDIESNAIRFSSNIHLEDTGGYFDIRYELVYDF